MAGCQFKCYFNDHLQKLVHEEDARSSTEIGVFFSLLNVGEAWVLKSQTGVSQHRGGHRALKILWA